uniref:BPTI/Kunitz inhibitor domain-containing protein n=1 Tax=Caenorhabditis japonica TaxID=281687 RepID=A0A8R1IJV7_CAEJA
MPPVLCSCCFRPYSEGYGQSNLLRFYYDVSSKQCRQFIYKGMGGYGNQFETEQKCRSSCGVPDGVHPVQTLATVPPTLVPTLVPTQMMVTTTSIPPIVTTGSSSS